MTNKLRNDLCVICSIYKHDQVPMQQLLKYHWSNDATDDDLRQHTHRHLLEICRPNTLPIYDHTRYGKGVGQTVYTTIHWYPVDDANPERGWYRLQMTWLHLKQYGNPAEKLASLWGFEKQKLRGLPEFKLRPGNVLFTEPPIYLRIVDVDYGQFLKPELWWTLPVARQPAPPTTPPPTPAPTFPPLLSCPPPARAPYELDTDQDVNHVRFIAAAPAASASSMTDADQVVTQERFTAAATAASASETTDKTTGEAPGSSSSGPFWSTTWDEAGKRFHEATRTGGWIFWRCDRGECGGGVVDGRVGGVVVVGGG